MMAPDRDDNPYAPPAERPSVELGLEPAGFVAVLGEDLIVPAETALPPLCVKTGRPITGPPLVEVFCWAPRWVRIAVIFQFPIGIILSPIFRRRARIAYHLEERFRAKARRIIRACWLMVLSACGLFAASLAAERHAPTLIPPGIFLMLAAPVTYFAHGRIIHASLIANGYVRLRGIPPRVMAALATAAEDAALSPTIAARPGAPGHPERKEPAPDAAPRPHR